MGKLDKLDSLDKVVDMLSLRAHDIIQGRRDNLGGDVRVRIFLLLIKEKVSAISLCCLRGLARCFGHKSQAQVMLATRTLCLFQS